MANNRFTNLRKAKPPVTESVHITKQNHQKQKVISVDSASEPTAVEGLRRGRPRAKRSSENFAQATAYVKKETYLQVKHKLLDQKKEYSILVQELLDDWLKAN